MIVLNILASSIWVEWIHFVFISTSIPDEPDCCTDSRWCHAMNSCSIGVCIIAACGTLLFMLFFFSGGSPDTIYDGPYSLIKMCIITFIIVVRVLFQGMVFGTKNVERINKYHFDELDSQCIIVEKFVSLLYFFLYVDAIIDYLCIMHFEKNSVDRPATCSTHVWRCHQCKRQSGTWPKTSVSNTWFY